MFGSIAVTTSFYDVGLSRPGIEPRFPAYEANGIPLRHRGGITDCKLPPKAECLAIFLRILTNLLKKNFSLIHFDVVSIILIQLLF